MLVMPADQSVRAPKFNFKASTHADPPARKAIDSRAATEPLITHQNDER